MGTYIPEPQLADPSDTRLIIFICDEMLPPLGLGITLCQAASGRYLGDLALQRNSAPVDKINFIRCCNKALRDGITACIIRVGLRAPSNRPIDS
ncbi:uncharacterized protein BCR38DRAFT_340362 [Pseudomassariella vexata]|uniref:Uncharacterized protein n=1 Tax=Pseudomassariella vexata TaxID=1141098 RepID=A0A1Y2E4L1_9PEZI|nr:uncharacterized protein BCR38DRAFT_340362 [Pseudomassariella vexata]ORY66491.1 hypothetical protein BCR38DRAFT_340362 [Pseudomassariella vexata]